MVRYAAYVLVVLLIGCRAASAPAPATPVRLVSLAPSITEVLFEIGLGPRIVGVTTFCTYPEAATRIPRVGGYLTPSLEAILALRPDLVVVLPEHADVTRQIEALGLATLMVDHGSLAGVIDSMQQLGARAGGGPSASRAARRLRDTLMAAAPSPPSSSAPPRVLLVAARTEDAARLHVAAPGTIHHELIARAGGRNALDSVAARYPTLSIEGVARLDPDVIVEFAPAGTDGAAWLQQWTVHRALRAVRTSRVHVFTDDFLPVPGPRFVRFAGPLAQVLSRPGQ